MREHVAMVGALVFSSASQPLLVIRESSANAGQDFWRDCYAPNGRCRRVLPGPVFAPVDVGAIAAAIRAAITAPQEEMSRRNIEAVRGDLPIWLGGIGMIAGR